jgi:hypothetical protein
MGDSELEIFSEISGWAMVWLCEFIGSIISFQMLSDNLRNKS